jgi:tight adherence protein C
MMPNQIAAIACLLAALAALLLAGSRLRRIASGSRSARTLADALERRTAQNVASATNEAERAGQLPEGVFTRGAAAGAVAGAGGAAVGGAAAEAAGASSAAAFANAGATARSGATGAGAQAAGVANPAGAANPAGVASPAGATHSAGSAHPAGATSPAGHTAKGTAQTHSRGTGPSFASAQAQTRPQASRAQRSRIRFTLDRAARAGIGWLDTRTGRLIVADEDRRLLDQCGYVAARARGLFLVARLACACALFVIAVVCADGRVDGSRYVALLLAAPIAGFMLPKIVVKRRAAARRDAVVDELPLLVDLLRLLQGVGLSLDQSLQVTIGDFQRMLPVLSSELDIAQRQFVAGRTREQSLQRLASIFDNDDLRAIVRLLIQVDRHGGAVQEPLKQFSERLREGRRALLREKIGRLTVKMTGVMVVTLLPALLIVTAGPGVLAVMHSLSQTQFQQHSNAKHR